MGGPAAPGLLPPTPPPPPWPPPTPRPGPELLRGTSGDAARESDENFQLRSFREAGTATGASAGAYDADAGFPRLVGGVDVFPAEEHTHARVIRVLTPSEGNTWQIARILIILLFYYHAHYFKCGTHLFSMYTV